MGNRSRVLALSLFAALAMIFMVSTSSACPLGNAVPMTDSKGVTKVCDAFGNVVAVRGFPPNKRITENRLFKTMHCPTLSGKVEPHKPRPREKAWPKNVTPMHFVCDVAMRRLDGTIVPLPRKAARRTR